MTKSLLLPILVVAALAAACGGKDDGMDMGGQGQLDQALAAMDRILAAYPDRIGYHTELHHWGLSLGEGLKVEWTDDTSMNAADVAFVLPAAMLEEAGVDPQALAASGWLYQEAVTGGEMGDMPALLIRPFDLGSAAAGPGGEDSASDAFARLLGRFPDALGFHEEMQHHGLALGDGNKLEWTEDLTLGDADVAMVFEAAPLLAAGADPALLEAAGWLHVDATTGEMAAPELLVLPLALP